MWPILLLLCWSAMVEGKGSCRESGLCCPGRDSSCVVQKTPVNAIIEDLSDKPCYCDHACMKLGDCCDDFKRACGVIDCEVSEWDEWTQCDADCGPGTMSRSRTVLHQPENGGKHCPNLHQKRGCQGTNCQHHSHRGALKETAMILPSKFGEGRKVNESLDIRKNLRLQYPEQEEEAGNNSEYCVEFEIIKASKACHKEEQLKALHDGSKVCVKCEKQAFRKHLGSRCFGHGVHGKITRFSSLNSPHCHGKWVRLGTKHDDVCPCKKGAAYIFV